MELKPAIYGRCGLWLVRSEYPESALELERDAWMRRYEEACEWCDRQNHLNFPSLPRYGRLLWD